MTHTLPRMTERRGISLIETLVVIGVLGVLTGLLIPAVQFSLEASRRSRCAANLKALGLAANNFAATAGAFPAAGTGKIANVPQRGLIGINSFSPQCMLLPYMEGTSAFNAINFDIPFDIALIEKRAGQWTIAAQTVATFLCPSDPQAVAGAIGPNSYRGCRGLELQVGRRNRSDLGVFDYKNRGTRPSEITDGLSHTVIFSEKPVGSGSGRSYLAFRDWAQVDRTARAGDEWVSTCAGITTETPKRNDAGATWVISGLAITLFNAACPPNNPIPDCGAGTTHGLFSARSYHAGGVLGVMADGSTRFFASSTSEPVWRALGTKSGGESVADLP